MANTVDGQCQDIDLCNSTDRCLNNGTCVMISAGDLLCECLEGFKGSLCQYNIDDCMEQPCLYGECEDMINGFRCNCSTGFSGESRCWWMTL